MTSIASYLSLSGFGILWHSDLSFSNLNVEAHQVTLDFTYSFNKLIEKIYIKENKRFLYRS